jgi:hypothetical protein
MENAEALKKFVAGYDVSPHTKALNERFRCDSPPMMQNGHKLGVVCNANYIIKLTALLDHLKPEVYGVIGVLYGSLEMMWLKLHTHKPKRIVACDVDMPEYNPKRDTISCAARNICGTDHGNFPGQYVHIRASSLECDLFTKCGPYSVVFVDGGHWREAVMNDMKMAWDSMSPGGTILVHDLDLPNSSVAKGYFDWIAGMESKGQKIDHAECSDKEFLLGLGIVKKPS